LSLGVRSQTTLVVHHWNFRKRAGAEAEKANIAGLCGGPKDNPGTGALWCSEILKTSVCAWRWWRLVVSLSLR